MTPPLSFLGLGLLRLASTSGFRAAVGALDVARLPRTSLCLFVVFDGPYGEACGPPRLIMLVGAKTGCAGRDLSELRSRYATRWVHH
jgi:hypothetical protein